MKPILEIQNLSKKLIINHESQSYVSLRERLASGFFTKRQKKEEFWALKDINFNVEPGDSIGIIGRNGAGKTTLLKILSKITSPTEGLIKCRGRIASLLEVGTGFHPELTGRENVYLNGSILGMKKREIDRQFDEIVSFAGTEQFLDTPLKHYSSGMSLRLAFSVAAFLEPEVLVIDEVLAVGDAEFQKKCMGKMEDVSKSGRTILFVSHNMAAIQSLCRKAMLIEKGRSQGLEEVGTATHKYLYGTEFTDHLKAVFELNPKKQAALLEVGIKNTKNEWVVNHPSDEPFFVEIKWVNNQGVPVTPNVELINHLGVKLFLSLDSHIDHQGKLKQEKGIYVSRVKIPANFLNYGQYIIQIGLDCAMPYANYDSRLNCQTFSIYENINSDLNLRGGFFIPPGTHALLPDLEWTYSKIQ